MKKDRKQLFLAVFLWSIVVLLLATLPLTLKGLSLYPPLTANRHILSIVFWACVALSATTQNRPFSIGSAVVALVVAAVGLFVK